MPEKKTILNVFVASPGDLPEGERDIIWQVCESLNRSYLKNSSIQLITRRWETDVYPEISAEHPQSELTEMAANSDILIAIFNRRLGRAGYSSRSGTVDEVEAALEHFEKTGQRPQVLAYFRIVHMEIPDDELVGVNEYKKALQARKVRTEDYKDAIHFQGRLFEALMKHIEKWLQKESAQHALELKTFKEQMSKVPQPLLDWPATIDGQWLERPELESILERINSKISEDRPSSSTTLLLGAPGAGKSALLAQLGKRFKEQGTSVLSIKADMVSSSVLNMDDLTEDLGLPMQAEECLRGLSMDGPVVLIVDQLDAVASIADRKSNRLNLLLNLIFEANNMDGVHIIASSRTFEYRHDTRLTTIDAEIVDLQQPSWDEIDKLLKNSGIDPEILSEEIKELLQTPLHLKLFKELLPKSSGRIDSAQSVQELYEELWRQKVLNAANSRKRTTLINILAERMSKEENLWAPISVADKFHSALDELRAEEVIKIEGCKIGFRHQTFYDFVVARRFAAGEDSLAKFVLERQDGLFVRPLLLAALDYLRATAIGSYHRELTALWNAIGLRTHLRVLLDEKIGSLQAPDEVEQGLILPFLRTASSSRRKRLLSAMAGSPGWFELIKTSYLPEFLSSEETVARRCAIILADAWKFAHDDVLHLIETYLLPKQEKDNLTLSILQGIDKWDEKAVNTLRLIAHRSNDYSIPDLTANLSKALPELAPKVVRADLERRLELTIQKDSEAPPPPELSENFTPEEIGKSIADENNKSVKNLFELGNEWYGLSDIAEADPFAFLDEVWPWFIKVLTRLAYDTNPLINEYRHDSIYIPALEGDEGWSNERQPIDAIHNAVIGLAKSDPANFLKFLNNNMDRPYILVHRLLARGLVNLAESNPEVILCYLTADPRRLSIGDFQDRLKESKMLISNLVKHLEEKDREKLEQYVTDWSYYIKNDAEWSGKEKLDRLKWNRGKRLSLLRSFPREHLSVKTKKLLDEEERAFPGTGEWDSPFSGMHEVGSRMSSGQMSKASDDQLTNLFDELDDSTQWDHPRFRFESAGGTIQASRELEVLAEKEPHRVLKLIRSFEPGRQEIAAGHAVIGLAKSGISTDNLFTLIKDLDSAGFATDGFRSDVANALEVRANKDCGLVDDVIALLESWLTKVSEPTFDKENSDGKERDGSNSVIWGHGGFRVLAGGRARIARTISLGYLLRKPNDIEGWKNFLLRILEFEKHPKVWQEMLPYLRYLFNDDKAKATNLIDRVFISVPQLLGSIEGVIEIASVLKNVTDLNAARKWLMGVRESEWSLARQAFGEVLLLWRCFYRNDDWAQKQIEDIINDINDTEDSVRVCRGLAFSASNLWHKVIEFQDICTDVLIRLSSSKDSMTHDAIAKVFRYGEPLPLNDNMKRIIEAILPNDALLIKSAENLIEGIEPLATAEPDLVYRISLRLLDVCNKNQTDILRISYIRVAESLVNIAITLQRTESHRVKGLELFETLLESEINEARQALYILDRRPIVSHTPKIRPHRRRRHRKRT